ncbi:uncharacterized protein L201_007334 [Kwoniella dendrophila CBS 6074]|uniref:BZIP domain-containing protein n=1 Tax=Kwoniella dendrophila CBS 6074 TaxID=1295534 RepID=A0AAX4K490_9TREE
MNQLPQIGTQPELIDCSHISSSPILEYVRELSILQDPEFFVLDDETNTLPSTLPQLPQTSQKIPEPFPLTEDDFAIVKDVEELNNFLEKRKRKDAEREERRARKRRKREEAERLSLSQLQTRADIVTREDSHVEEERTMTENTIQTHSATCVIEFTHEEASHSLRPPSSSTILSSTGITDDVIPSTTPSCDTMVSQSELEVEVGSEEEAHQDLETYEPLSKSSDVFENDDQDSIDSDENIHDVSSKYNATTSFSQSRSGIIPKQQASRLLEYSSGEVTIEGAKSPEASSSRTFVRIPQEVLSYQNWTDDDLADLCSNSSGAEEEGDNDDINNDDVSENSNGNNDESSKNEFDENEREQDHMVQIYQREVSDISIDTIIQTPTRSTMFSHPQPVQSDSQSRKDHLPNSPILKCFPALDPSLSPPQPPRSLSSMYFHEENPSNLNEHARTPFLPSASPSPTKDSSMIFSGIIIPGHPNFGFGRIVEAPITTEERSGDIED